MQSSGAARISSFIRENVLGLVAIFIALSGTAVAATGGPEAGDAAKGGKVQTADLANKAVTAPKIAPGAVKGRKVRDGSLKGRHIDQSTLDFALLQRRIGEGCSPGAAIRAVKQSGEVVCEPLSGTAPPSGPAGGDLTGTYPDPQIAPNAVGSAQIDPAEVQRRVTGSCPAGEAATAVAADGSVTCASPGGPPTGPAGGDLGGTYPNPTLGTGVVGTSQVGALPAARVIATTSQEIGTNTSQDVDLDTVVYSEDISFSPATDSLVIETPGIYALAADASWSINPSGARRLRITKFIPPLTTSILAENIENAVSGFGMGQEVGTVARLGPGDEISLEVTQSSGGDVDLQFFDGRAASLSATWLAPAP